MILVTGGAGFVGSHTVIELLQNGYEVIIIDDYSNSSPKVIKRIEKITNKTTKVYNFNIMDQVKLDKVFKENTIEAVIHFAAYKAVGESVEEPLKYYKNNVAATVTLLETMKENNVNRIVFSSSATVYGTKNKSPLHEKMAINNATNPYGYTKIMNEQILKDTAYAYPEWGVVLLRYFNPIGAHPSGLIGEEPEGIPSNIMPYITKVAIGQLEKLSIFGNDYDTHDGTGVRDYIHVVDLAVGHVKAVGKVLNEQGTYIYNLGTGKGYSVLHLVNTFQEATGRTIPYKIGARRAGDVGEVYADPTLAAKELNWTAQRNLYEMCRDSWHWQELNPDGYQ